MAIVLQEDWSSYPENTEVRNIPGWNLTATYEPTKAILKVNATADLKVTAGNAFLASYDASSPSHYIEQTMVINPTGGSVWYECGLAVRAVDYKNMIWYRTTGATIQILSTIGGTQTVLGSISGVDLTIGSVVRLEVDNSTETLRMYKDGVQISADVDITGILSGTQVGMTSRSKTEDPLFGDVEIGTLSSDVISITPHKDRVVIPVFGATHSHTVAGTFIGTPGSIFCRVEEFVSGQTVLDWAVLDSNPMAGVYSGQVDLPKGKYYRILTRFSSNTSVETSTSRIGFGLMGDGGGQSNMVGLFGIGGDAVVSDDTAIFDGTNWNKPLSQHIAHLLNELSVANNCVVGMYTTASSSSSISQHLPSGSLYVGNKAKQTAAGGKENFYFWGQGEGDTSNAATYKNSLNLLYQDKLSTLGQTTDTLPMFIVQLGRNAGSSGNDAGWQGVREAQTLFANETANVYISHQTMDLPMIDGLHRNASGFKMEALRAADTINSIIVGGTSGLGPIPTTAVLLGDTLTIEHSLNGSASLTVPGTVVDNFEVSSDDFATTIPIISSSVSGSAIEFTLGSTPTGNVKVRSQQGQDPIVANMATGSKLYNGQEVMIAPIVTSITSQGAINSTAVFNVTGIPNGTYLVTVFSASRPATLIFSSNLVFSGGIASISVSIAAGTQLYGIVRDSSDPSIGTAALKTITT